MIQRDEMSAPACAFSKPHQLAKTTLTLQRETIVFVDPFILCEETPRQQTIVVSDKWNQYSLSGLRMLLLVSSAFSTSDLSE